MCIEKGMWYVHCNYLSVVAVLCKALAYTVLWHIEYIFGVVKDFAIYVGYPTFKNFSGKHTPTP